MKQIKTMEQAIKSLNKNSKPTADPGKTKGSKKKYYRILAKSNFKEDQSNETNTIKKKREVTFGDGSKYEGQWLHKSNSKPII
jgi:hypothetical protein